MTKTKIRALACVAALALLGLAAVADAEIAQRDGLRVTVQGELAPKALPRGAPAPVNVSVSADISSSEAAEPPQLSRMTIAINRYGKLDSTGLPVCKLEQIQPATTADSLAVCRRSLVGEGTFSASVPASGRAPFPSTGKLYAFNGELDGRPAILAHVYGTKPAPTSFTLAFVIARTKGTFGTTLKVDLPKVGADGGAITGISLKLGKNFTSGGKKRAYISASCPAPKGFSKAPFPLAKTSFDFVGAKSLSSTLTRTCKVRG